MAVFAMEKIMTYSKWYYFQTEKKNCFYPQSIAMEKPSLI